MTPEMTQPSSAMERTTPPPAIPLLGMIVDRTSFDETDDYGVDREALSISPWSIHPSPSSNAAMVMKNGKVRRRLRWRPKGMAKKKRPPANINSNASVVSTSNNSQSSKTSKKSLHSIASTETLKKNNTKNSNLQKFPLPRPNYPDTFDGVATIGNEGNFVHARRMDRSGSLLSHAASDLLPQNSDAAVFGPSQSTLSTGASPKRMKLRNPGLPLPPKRKGMPPLFRGKEPLDSSPLANNSSSGISDLATHATSTPLTEAISSSSSTDSSSRARDEDESYSLPLPSLSGEDEFGRRVDLRIPSERRESSGSLRSTARATTTTGSIMSVQELRHDAMRLLPTELTLNMERVPMSDLAAEPEEEEEDQTSETSSETYSEGLSPTGLSKPRHTSPRRKPQAGVLDQEMGDVDALSASESDGVDQASTTQSEFRFSMSAKSPKSTKGSDADRAPPSPCPSTDSQMSGRSTGPIDTDDGSFLEVEKNLQAIHDMATEHLQHGEYSEALEVFEEILRGQLARYGPDHFRVGTALHNIGIVHMKRGDFDNAVKVCKEAVLVRKQALEPNHPDVAVSLAQLGVAYLESRRHKKAIVAFREALKIRRHTLGSRHPKVAKILNNIGCALYELDELEIAKVAFEEALDVQRATLREYPVESETMSDQALLSIACTLSNIGSIKLYSGMFEEASRDLEESLLLQQSVLGDDHPLAQRTQESLDWVDQCKNMDPDSLLPDVPTSWSNGSQRVFVDRELLLCAQSSREQQMESKRLSVFEMLEQKLRALHRSLDINCGGERGFSDDESASSV